MPLLGTNKVRSLRRHINSLNPIVHFWLHRTMHAGSASAERVGQGEVGVVTHRVTCTW